MFNLFLNNKRVAIIGGSSGIGLAVAQASLAAGAEVIIAGRTQSKLDQAKEELGGDNIKTIIVDIKSESSIKQLFKTIGKIDHLHITAAELNFGDLDALSIKDAKANMDSKFWGTYVAIKYGHSHVAENGSITLYSGAASQKPNGDAPLVSAITSAIESLSKALAISLSPVRVNAVSPGITLTPLIKNYGQKTVENILIAHKEQLLIRRYGKPEEVAQAAIYLMSNEYVTGTVQAINGGLGVA